MLPLTQSPSLFAFLDQDIDDIKFSPDGSLLAAASHDNFIDIFEARAPASCFALFPHLTPSTRLSR
jgi:WD40 repeat protein